MSGSSTPKSLPSSGQKSLHDIKHPLSCSPGAEDDATCDGLLVSDTPSPDLIHTEPSSIGDKVRMEGMRTERGSRLSGICFVSIHPL